MLALQSQEATEVDGRSSPPQGQGFQTRVNP